MTYGRRKRPYLADDPDFYLAEMKQMRANFRKRVQADREAAKYFKDGLFCPECGVFRVTAETYRVHRWLAHDVKEAAA